MILKSWSSHKSKASASFQNPQNKGSVELIPSPFLRKLPSLIEEGANSVLDLSTFSSQKFQCLQTLGFKQIQFAECLKSDGEQGYDFDFSNLGKTSDFHIVFAWDFFNHLSVEAIKPVVHKLFEKTNSQAHMIALFHGQSKMPALPVKYDINFEDRAYQIPLNTFSTAAMQKQSPRYNTRQLSDMFVPFSIATSSLCSFSIREVVFHK